MKKKKKMPVKSRMPATVISIRVGGKMTGMPAEAHDKMNEMYFAHMKPVMKKKKRSTKKKSR